MADVRSSARELLALERIHRDQGLDGVQSAQWLKLAAILFPHSDQTNTRRTIRFDADLTGTVSIDQRLHPVHIHQLSRIGMSMEGDALRNRVPDSPIELVNITLDSEAVPLGLACTIAQYYPPSKIGVQVSPESDAAAKKLYFERIYYPMYIRHLESLAAT